MEDGVGAFDIRALHRPNQAQLLGDRLRVLRQCPRSVIGFSCGAFLIVLILIVVSLGSVHPTEYGLRYNRFTKQVDTTYVYRGGRHLIGAFSSMLTFPATVQTLEFSNRNGAKAPPLSTRTAEGLALTLHVAFQYHLTQDEVPALYKLANMNYESLYMKVARDILLKAAAKYNAPQYWTERLKIGQEMLHLVNAALQSSHATCTGLQVIVIELPDQYEASIVATQVQKQGVRTRENEQRAAVIRAEIGVMVAEYQRNISVTLSAAQAGAALVIKSAEAQAARMRIEAEDSAMATVHGQLGLTPAGLVGYQRGSAYQTLPNATFLFGVPNAVAVLGASSAGGVSAPAPVAAAPAAACRAVA